MKYSEKYEISPEVSIHASVEWVDDGRYIIVDDQKFQCVNEDETCFYDDCEYITYNGYLYVEI